MKPSPLIKRPFNKDCFTNLMKCAKGPARSKAVFAQECGLSVGYISKCFNNKLTTPPNPNTLEKIALHAVGGVDFVDLLEACGYDPRDFLSREIMAPTKCLIHFMSFMHHSKFAWMKAPLSETADFPGFAFEIIDEEISYWFLDAESIIRNDKEKSFESIINIYGKLASFSQGIVKYSFFTDSEYMFNEIINNLAPPCLLHCYVSIVLVKEDIFSEEVYLTSAIPVSEEHLEMFSIK